MALAIAFVAAAVAGALGFMPTSPAAAADGASRLWARFAIGGVVGLLSATAFQGAIGFCAFADDAETNEPLLGAVATATIAWMVAAGVSAVRGQQASDLGSGELRTGTFRAGWYWPWLLLAPTLAILVVFLYLPAIQTFTLSTKLTRLGTPRVADRCLSNYSELLVPNSWTVALLPLGAIALIAALAFASNRVADGSLAHGVIRAVRPFGVVIVLTALYFIFENENGGYRQIYLNTVVISTAIVALSMVFGLGLAYLAFNRVRGISVYRTLLIWPYAISPPVAGILFFMLFNSSGGIIAAVADEWFGLTLPNYAQDAFLARSVVVLSSVWKLLGYNLLFFLAGLQTIPRDQIEAAAIDGANAFQRLTRIVLPGLAPIAFFLLITNLTYSFFDIYGTIDFLTKGAPAGATSVSIYEIIRVGVDNGDLGRGAAQSVVLFIAVIIMTAWQFKQSEGRISYGSG